MRLLVLPCAFKEFSPSRAPFLLIFWSSKVNGVYESSNGNFVSFTMYHHHFSRKTVNRKIFQKRPNKIAFNVHEAKGHAKHCSIFAEEKRI